MRRLTGGLQTYWHSVSYILAMCLGATTVLAFAPYHLSWIAVITLAILFAQITQATTVWQAAGIGYAYGLGLFGVGIAWLRISIAQFGGIGLEIAWIATLLFIAVASGYIALFAGIVRYLADRIRPLFIMLWVAPGLWVGVEILRSELFTGFPWLVIGYSQSDSLLAGYAPLIGVLGISAMLALSAGLLNYWRKPLSWFCLAIIWGLGAGLEQVTWTTPVGEPIQVSLIQGNIAQKDKWQPTWYDETLRRYRSMTEQVPKSRLVVWPETAIPAFDTQVEQTVLQPLHQRLQAQQRDLLTGVVVKKPDGRYYNAMVSLGHSGQDAYFKRHLVPFGEYLPWKPWLGPLFDFLQIPMSNFSAGTADHPVLKLAGHLAGIDICYEDAFAREVMRALPAAGYLVNASNDAWFGDSLAPHQHLQIARMRAKETERYLLRSTNTGISAIIDPKGRIQNSAAQFEQAIVTGKIHARQGATPYVYWGDWPVYGLLLLALLVALRLYTKALDR